MRAEFAGARRRGFVDLAAQFAVVGVHHHRQKRRHVQGELPAALAVALGRLAGRGTCAFRQPGELLFIGDEQFPGIGGVEHILLELALPGGEFLLDVLEAFFVGFVQFRARQAKVAQDVVDDFLLRGREAGEIRARRHCLVGAVQALVLLELGAVVAELRQTVVVGGAQRLIVHHRIKMRHRRPQAAEALVHVLDWLHEAVPGRLVCIGEQTLDGGTIGGERGIHRRFHVFRADRGEVRQAGEIEQRIECQIVHD